MLYFANKQQSIWLVFVRKLAVLEFTDREKIQMQQHNIFLHFLDTPSNLKLESLLLALKDKRENNKVTKKMSIQLYLDNDCLSFSMIIRHRLPDFERRAIVMNK